jgi:hypothetical protein
VVLDYNEQLKFMNVGHRKQRRLEIIAELNKQGEEEKAVEQYSEQVLPKHTPPVTYRNRYSKQLEPDTSDLVLTENVIQLPWSVQSYQTANSAMEEAKMEERRKEQGRKLREQMVKRQ